MIGIIDSIRKQKGLLSIGTVDSKDIQKAETELAVSFAPEYKEYTSTFGAVSFGGTEYTGVVQADHLNVVAVTKAARKIAPEAHQDWYVVLDPHFDGIVIWQDKEGKIYQTEPNKEPIKIAENLETYMRSTSDLV